MSDDGRNTDMGVNDGVRLLLASAIAAETRAADRLHGAIADVAIDDAVRMDDRTRLRLRAVLAQLAGGVETALRSHAAQLLILRDEAGLAARLTDSPTPVFARLNASGLLRDPALIGELLGRVREDAVAEALAIVAPDDPDRPSLLPRLLHHANPLVGTGAAALMTAESRRHSHAPVGTSPSSDLPAELHHHLVWWSAAALRMAVADTGDGALWALDRALAEAATHAIAAYVEEDRLEAVAMRLASALNPDADARTRLLVEALSDRRLSLVIALLAQGLGLEYTDMREIVLDPGGERLWLALRALDLDRATIARIGLALAEADPQRDIDAFADVLDVIVATDCTVARQALAPLRLHREYRAALRAVERGVRLSWPSGAMSG
jgi:hypothetical protein